MIRSNKEIFESLVRKILSDTLKLTNYLVELYGVKEKYFLTRDSKENAVILINDKCACNIIRMCSGILKRDIEPASEKDDNNIAKQKYHRKNLVSMLKKDFFICPSTDEQILIIIQEIVNAVKDKESVNIAEVLYDINKYNPDIQFYEEGKKLIKQHKSIVNPWPIKQELPDTTCFAKMESATKKLKEMLIDYNWCAIEGEPGSGKYTLALQYAVDKQNVYDFIFILPWQKTLDETLAQIITSDDGYYTCQKNDINKKYETEQERSERKRKILLGRNERILIVIYDVWDELRIDKIEEICDNKTSDIHLIITTQNNYENAVALPEATNEIYKKIFSSVCPNLSFDNYRTDINRLKEISNENLYRFKVLLQYVYKGHSLSAEDLYNDYKNCRYRKFFYDTTEITTEYHGKAQTASLAEHMKTTFLFQKLTAEQTEQLYHTVLLLDEKMNISCFTRTFNYQSDFYTELKKQLFLTYNKEKNSLSFSILLQMLLLHEANNDNYSICEHLFFNFAQIKTSAMDKCYCVIMLFRCLEFQIQRLNEKEQYQKHIDISFWYYNSIFEIFPFQCILPYSLMKNIPTEAHNLSDQNQELLIHQAAFRGLHEKIVNSIKRYILFLLCNFSPDNLINYLYNCTINITFNELMLYFITVDTDEMLIDDINKYMPANVEMPSIRLCYYYRLNNNMEFEQALNKIHESMDKYNDFSFLYNIVIALMYFEARPSLLQLMYDRFSASEKQDFCFYAAITMLEIILGKEIDLSPLIQSKADILADKKIYLFPIIILLEKYRPACSELKDLDSFYGLTANELDYWKNIEKMDFALDVTKTTKRIETWCQIFSDILDGDEYPIQEKAKRAIDLLNTSFPLKYEDQTIDSIISCDSLNKFI